MKYPWVSVCTLSNNIFCHVCCNAKSQNLIGFSIELYNFLFVGGGFSNWKNVQQKSTTNGKSEMHQEEIMKLSALSRAKDFSVQHSKSHDDET